MIIESLDWQDATVAEIRSESSRTKTFVLTTNNPYLFVAGQHLIARVTLKDGFKSSRGYSMSSAPSSGVLEITVAKAPHGEVSGWFCDECKVGDNIEITRPIGTEFMWSPIKNEETLLIAGGIGVAPYMSMIRENQSQNSPSLLKLLYVAQNFDELCFKDELLDPKHSDNFTFMLTRSAPDDWHGLRGRITTEILESLTHKATKIYICGPYEFVASVKSMLIENLQITPSVIRVEKFN